MIHIHTLLIILLVLVIVSITYNLVAHRGHRKANERFLKDIVDKLDNLAPK